MPIDRFAFDRAAFGENAIEARCATRRDLRLLHAVAVLLDRPPTQVLHGVGEEIGIATSYNRLCAGTRLPNAVRGALRDILNKRSRREAEIRAACIVASHDLTRLILGMSGLALLAVSLMLH